MIKDIKLHWRYYASNHAVPHQDMERFEADYDIQFRALRMQLTRYVLAQELESKTVEWPADWWQAFRQRWFPKRWLKRHPVKMESCKLVARATYPDIIHPPGQTMVIKFNLEKPMDQWG